jgi:hypothetical protein
VRLADRHPAYAFAIGLCLAVVLIVGAQALAQASAPPAQQMSQTKLIGQTGFAYLGGLRMMAAGLLWGSLDSQFHQYRTASKFTDRLDLLPAIRIVQLLNPQLEQPYYFTSYVLAERGRMGDALDLARDGIRNSPRSGLLRANYIQLLAMQDRKRNLPTMLEQAKIGLGPDMQYVSVDDKFESYGIFRIPFEIIGDQATIKAIDAEQSRMQQPDAAPADQPQSGVGGVIGAWTNSATPKEDSESRPTSSGAK